jgi:ribosomal protein S18 acetylase RimI-like enzyme
MVKTGTPVAIWLKDVNIRHLKESDLPALEWDGEFTHFRNVFAEAYQRQQTGMSILWVAELHNAGIIGQVFIQFNCDRPELANGIDRAYLYSFRVRSQYRSQGLGSLILTVSEQDLSDRGYRFITLNVARDNLKAQALYARHGYRIVAPEAGIWSFQDESGKWRQVTEPAWRMEKRL